MQLKVFFHILLLVLLSLFIPRIMLFYLICGLIDFYRSQVFDLQNVQRYFLGNGMLTWILSPFNILMDMLSFKNKQIYLFNELPQECQDELYEIFNVVKDNPTFIDEIDKKMEDKKRGMLFFKWYGKNINTSLNIPQFHEQYKWVNTIGVSVFNRNQRTSIHYGPLRVTLRVLYNLVHIQNDNIYIQVGNFKHKWHDNPVFIFDDTLVHQSVNDSDKLRYLLFIDIIRPTSNIKLLKYILNCLQYLLISINRIFYKNWDFLK